jgi:adenosylcobinamide-phosphate synthase
MSALVTLVAVILDAVLGEPRRWHPLVGFGRWAQYLERALNPGTERGNGALRDAIVRQGLPGGRNASEGSQAGAEQHNRAEQHGSAEHGSAEQHGSVGQHPLALKSRGVLAVLIAVAPWILLTTWVATLPLLRYPVAVAALYFALGQQSLRQHALRVRRALDAGNLEEARKSVGLMVSRDTGTMDPQAVAAAAVESVLENGNDAVFGALFWFLIAGAPGVVLYRLANTLDAMWGYRTPRYLYFGWAAARLDDVLNFVPARLTALTYALIGSTRNALYCWRSQAPAWESPNAGPVMAAGAGALDLGLGGGAYYHGHWEERPPLGVGRAPDAAAITSAVRLVRVGVLLWLLVVITVEGVAHA